MNTNIMLCYLISAQSLILANQAEAEGNTALKIAWLISAAVWLIDIFIKVFRSKKDEQ